MKQFFKYQQFNCFRRSMYFAIKPNDKMFHTICNQTQYVSYTTKTNIEQFIFETWYECMLKPQKEITSWAPCKQTNIRIEAEANKHMEIHYAHPILCCGVPIVETTGIAVEMLDKDSAFCPKLIPARILKRCSKFVAPVLHLLILDILKFD